MFKFLNHKNVIKKNDSQTLKLLIVVKENHEGYIWIKAEHSRVSQVATPSFPTDEGNDVIKLQIDPEP